MLEQNIKRLEEIASITTLAMLYEANAIVNNGTVEGVALPLNVAPYKLYIVPKTDDSAKLALANKLHDTLIENGVDAKDKI